MHKCMCVRSNRKERKGRRSGPEVGVGRRGRERKNDSVNDSRLELMCWSFNGPEPGGPESKREKEADILVPGLRGKPLESCS